MHNSPKILCMEIPWPICTSVIKDFKEFTTVTSSGSVTYMHAHTPIPV